LINGSIIYLFYKLNQLIKNILHFSISFAITFLLMLKTGCQPDNRIIPGAERTDAYVPIISGKKIAIAANQTSMIGPVHLLDSLISIGIDVVRIFSPEHGFRGDVDDGVLVRDGFDDKTGIPVRSLYQENLKPDKTDLEDIDIVIFDIQDVGVRFYTFISTLHYIMQACAENNTRLIVLDRPDPNGFYVDGPVLEPEFRSFVGMHEVPIVYGMTIGEYAMMINGEGWLGEGLKCNLTVISCRNYDHLSKYDLPIKPSPNLPAMNGIYLYPSLALFEGTSLSVGRGTDFPFEVFGHPCLTNCSFFFIPESKPGADTNPVLKGEKCYGFDLRQFRNLGHERPAKLDLQWLLFAYSQFPDKNKFFNDYFEKLAGNSILRKQIIMGLTEDEIRESWKENLEKFREIRKKYLLYKDFE
jgi:uncharacterized protein YbbC (DUF1343 family)